MYYLYYRMPRHSHTTAKQMGPQTSLGRWGTKNKDRRQICWQAPCLIASGSRWATGSNMRSAGALGTCFIFLFFFSYRANIYFNCSVATSPHHHYDDERGPRRVSGPVFFFSSVYSVARLICHVNGSPRHHHTTQGSKWVVGLETSFSSFLFYYYTNY
jgi:hypothetical protein